VVAFAFNERDPPKEVPERKRKLRRRTKMTEPFGLEVASKIEPWFIG
jgi:hypothetical protein